MRKFSIFIVLSFIATSVFGQMSTGTFHVKHIENNTKRSDYVTFLNEDKVIFVSPIKERKRNGLSGLFTGSVNNEGEIIGKEIISDFSKNKISKTGITYTKDSKTVYFSSNNLRKVYSKSKEYRRRRVNNKKSQLFKATIEEDGSRSNIEVLPFNKKRYTYESPVLSNDGKQLYFVSNRKSTLGGKDIFVVDIKADGSFGVPQNLGSTINTKGDEVTPFITKDNKLYFSSNGREDTFGNLDVYVSELNNGNPTEPLHLDEPINSDKDDFAFIINNKNTKGFISSNRETKRRKNNDIYSFTAKGITSEPCVQEIAGVIKDSETKEIIKEAIITLFDETNNEIDQVKTDEDGAYRFTLDCDKTYNLTVSEQAYEMEEYTITTSEYYNEPTIEADKLLVKKIETIDDDLSNIESTINLIYFGFDKSNITQESKTELDKIVEILEDNLKIHLEIAAYTDSRGSDAYNLALSERRANAALDYLVAKGVDSNRIVAIGHGESKLINKCSNNTECSEAAHKENRRIEFSFTNPPSEQHN